MRSGSAVRIHPGDADRDVALQAERVSDGGAAGPGVRLDRRLRANRTSRGVEHLAGRTRFPRLPIGYEEDRALSGSDRSFERLEVRAVRQGPEERTRHVERLTTQLERYRGRLVRRIDDERREARHRIREGVGNRPLEIEVTTVRASVGLRRCARLLALGRAAGEVVGACVDHGARARVDDRATVERALEVTGLGVGSASLGLRVEARGGLSEATSIVAAGADQCNEATDEGHGAERAVRTEQGPRAPHGSFTSTGVRTDFFGSPAPSWP